MLTLTAEESDMLNGESRALRLAMQLVVAEGEALGAERLIQVSSAHVVDTLQVGLGETAFDFASLLRRDGLTVRVPTTLNTANIDGSNPGINSEDPADVKRQLELMDTYEALGCKPLYTCSPFQEVPPPALGEHVAWGESNAVSFVNSVYGARTIRHGHFSSISAALTGRAPHAGLHLDENRRGEILFTLDRVPDDAFDDDLFYHLLGYLVGTQAGARNVVVDGLPTDVVPDRLKAFGAAATTSGAVAMYHLVGLTPEATTVEEAFHNKAVPQAVAVNKEMLREARDAVSSLDDGVEIGCVALGAPHLSLNQLRTIRTAIEGETGEARVPIFASASRGIVAEAEAEGTLEALRRAGVQVIRDKCSYFGGILSAHHARVMTDSAKWADYAPRCLGARVAIGSIEECIGSAFSGSVIRRERNWL